jgi:hypothetical protein
MEYEQLGALVSELMPGATMASQLYAEALFHAGSHLEPLTFDDLLGLLRKLVRPAGTHPPPFSLRSLSLSYTQPPRGLPRHAVTHHLGHDSRLPTATAEPTEAGIP